MSVFKSNNRPVWADYLLLTLGALIIAVSVKNIFDPANMVIGGASGLAIIIKAKLGVPLWLTNTLFNVPLFIGAYKIKGWKFIKRTVYATVALSAWLYVIPDVPFVADDLLLVALYGGIVCGVGTGMVLLAMATTGENRYSGSPDTAVDTSLFHSADYDGPGYADCVSRTFYLWSPSGSVCNDCHFCADENLR